LTQVPIAGLSPDAEPSARDLANIVDLAREKQIKYIFFESLVSPRFAETIAEEIGARTMVLDPLEGLTEAQIRQGKTYFTVMQDNLSNLEIALECTT
jgi:zinc transport system substrate-binding protein